MDLSKYSLDELEDILQRIPTEIARKEGMSDSDQDAKRRKLSVWASLEELAKKQGIDLSKM